MATSKKYYAHGKLLITGEYAVLDGAIALAIPTKKGQWLEVIPQALTDNINWTSIDVEGNEWFNATFSSSLEIIKTSSNKIARTLQKILQSTFELNANFKKDIIGTKVLTTLEFDRNWGLGSSSTLINLIAQWATVDPFILLQNSFGGSGYDIACANAAGPILFQNTNPPIITPVNFSPEWTDKMHFTHKYIPHLRKFIYTCFAHKVSKRKNSGVVLLGVGVKMAIYMHGPKLGTHKRLAI